MKRTLKLPIGPDKDSGGLELTVTNTESESDDSNAEVHAFKHRDALASDNVLKAAVGKAVDSYLVLLKDDAKKAMDESPIGRAAKG